MRPAAGRKDEQVAGDGIAALEPYGQRAVLLLLDLLHLRIEAEIDPLHRRDLEQPIADLLVIAAQQRARTVHDGHMAAERVEDARKFIRDIAAAPDHDPLRALLQLKHLVGRDAMFRALATGNDGPTPGQTTELFP